MNKKYFYTSFIALALIVTLPLKTLCAVTEISPVDTSTAKDSIQKKTVFNAGDDGIDSYRIPTLVTSKKGTLLLFTEARKVSSTDKTPTDIALKRSEDNGITWSNIHILT